MSMILMAKAMKMKVGNPLRKLVLIKLCDNANDEGECWPSIQNIAEQCEISKRSVIRHIQDLSSCGILSAQKRFVDAKQTSNIYTIVIGENTTAKARVGLLIDGVGRGDTESLGGVTQSHWGGDTESLGGVTQSHPESISLNLSTESSKKINKKKSIPKPLKPEPFDPATLGRTMPQEIETAWLRWIEYRKLEKLTMNQITMTGQAEDLIKLSKAGHDAIAIINTSINGGYKTFYEPKNNNGGFNNGNYQQRKPRESAVQRSERQANEIFIAASRAEAGLSDVETDGPDLWPQVDRSGG